MVKPMRSIAIFGAVGALVAGVALPAVANTVAPADAAATLQQVAEDDAQSLIVASEATAAPLDRSTYSATSQQEIDEKKAEEAAQAAAAAAAAAATASSDYDTSGYALVAPGSGEVRWPLPDGSWQLERTLSGSHDGADMSGPTGTPLYAAAAGTVTTAGYHSAYGNMVTIQSVVGGQSVTTLYGHMASAPIVSVGETVTAGQMIGQRGSTGRSTGPHLHFEVRINGSLVEPIAWLTANAG